MTIERFTGHAVPLGGLTGLPQGYYGLPGGGYRGLTDELDLLVMDAARHLVAEYGRDVQIRFNSDRCSGKAFLRDDATRDSLIGVGGALRKEYPAGLTEDERFRDYRYGSPAYRALPDVLVVETYVAASAVPDLILTTTYSAETHESLHAAMDWLHENVRLPA
jgi:hypothetical protein